MGQFRDRPGSKQHEHKYIVKKKNKTKKNQLQEKVCGHFGITMIFALIGFKMKINLYAFKILKQPG